LAKTQFFGSDSEFGVGECFGEWVLKNSTSQKIRTNPGIENVQTIRESRLWGILTRCNFCGFMTTEFFNSHAIYHSPRFRRTAGFRKADDPGIKWREARLARATFI
jgi:hypothetical protein